MWSLNPAVHIRDSWNNTKTWWGKLAVVLFYSFLWAAIIKSVVIVISPKALPRVGCLLHDMDPFAESFVTLLLRGFSLFVLAYVIYVHKDGLHMWNVCFFTIFILLWIAIAIAGMRTIAANDPNKTLEKCMGSISKLIWITPTWIGVILIATVIDERPGSSGSEEEREPLTA